MTNQKKGFSFINFIPGLLMLIASFVVIYYVTTGIYAILSYIAIGLFVITAVIDYRVILNFGKTLINLLQRNPIAGLVGIGLTFFLYPLVALFLFGKAMLLRKVKQMTQQFDTRVEEEFVEYEEVEDVHPTKPEIVELPPVREKRKPETRNDYEDLFEE